VALRGAYIVFIATVAAGSAACTLLARFDDLPLLDAGVDASANEAGPDSAPPDDGHAPEASPVDAGVDVEVDANVDPCVGKTSGAYCGGDGVVYSSADLVLCDGGAVALIVACDGGCLPLSNPFPDTCNECNAKPDGGSFCGRDFPGFPARDADWLIQCQQGNAVQRTACQHGCISSGASSACAP
jgi:hypothetical protein